MRSVKATAKHSNLEIVQGLFAAFGKGDLPTVLSALAPEVEWRVSGPGEVPYAGTRRGRDQVRHFFEELGRAVEFQRFEPQAYISEGDTVVVPGQEKLQVRATRRTIENAWVMVFTLRRHQVVGFREFNDTAALAAGFSSAQHGGL